MRFNLVVLYAIYVVYNTTRIYISDIYKDSLYLCQDLLSKHFTHYHNRKKNSKYEEALLYNRGIRK